MISVENLGKFLMKMQKIGEIQIVDVSLQRLRINIIVKDR